MIPRLAEKELLKLARQYYVVAVVGPRQSGKTTLIKKVFKDRPYVNLEAPDVRSFAEEDPRAFLEPYTLTGAVFDEAQRVPKLFSYLQVIIDENKKPGHFILSGSNNFLLQENISQSLAGRVSYINLLPFSIEELGSLNEKNIAEMLFKGFYPPVYDRQIASGSWYNNYIRTYIERDVRQLKGIENLATFERFLKLCAGRVGQLLNKNSLGIAAGVDSKTVESWLSVLEASFVIFRLRPHHKNFNKRVVKMPKLYFYDVGLAVTLLGVQNAEQVNLHPFKGALFENLVIVEYLKQRWNSAKPNNLYFWRNSRGNEIDLLLDQGNALSPIEIKAGKTITPDFFKGLKYWQSLTANKGGT
ncbi:MAG: ATP-binding protein, partial [Marinirhabdus sp.]